MPVTPEDIDRLRDKFHEELQHGREQIERLSEEAKAQMSSRRNDPEAMLQFAERWSEELKISKHLASQEAWLASADMTKLELERLVNNAKKDMMTNNNVQDETKNDVAMCPTHGVPMVPVEDATDSRFDKRQCPAPGCTMTAKRVKPGAKKRTTDVLSSGAEYSGHIRVAVDNPAQKLYLYLADAGVFVDMTRFISADNGIDVQEPTGGNGDPIVKLTLDIAGMPINVSELKSAK